MTLILSDGIEYVGVALFVYLCIYLFILDLLYSNRSLEFCGVLLGLAGGVIVHVGKGCFNNTRKESTTYV